MFESMSVVKNAGLADVFDKVLSVDPAKMYKPHSSVYAIAVEELRLQKPSEVCCYFIWHELIYSQVCFVTGIGRAHV